MTITFSVFDNIEEICNIAISDSTERAVLLSAVTMQKDRVNADIQDTETESDDVDTQTLNKWIEIESYINTYYAIGNNLIEVSKRYLNSFREAINHYYKKGVGLTSPEQEASLAWLEALETAMVSIDRKP